MDINEAIEELKNVGDFLNYRLGTESYEVRCKIYDIRNLLMEQVKNSVVLADVSNFVCPVCKSNKNTDYGSDLRECHNCYKIFKGK